MYSSLHQRICFKEAFILRQRVLWYTLHPNLRYKYLHSFYSVLGFGEDSYWIILYSFAHVCHHPRSFGIYAKTKQVWP